MKRLMRTDGGWLYPDALFDVRIRRVIVIQSLEDLFAAECVDKRGAAWESVRCLAIDGRVKCKVKVSLRTGAGCTTDHDAELDTLLDILLAPNLHLHRYRSAFLSRPFTLGLYR